MTTGGIMFGAKASGILLGIFLAILVGNILLRNLHREDQERDAIRHKAGRYCTDLKGRTFFVWNDEYQNAIEIERIENHE